MGYKRDKTYLLQFADGEFAGFEVRLKTINIGLFTRMSETMMTLDRAKPEDQMKETSWLMEQLAGRIVSWNLEDDEDNPVVPSVENLNEYVDLEMAMVIIEHWMTAMGDISGPLEENSTSGVPAEVASLPTETLSASQSN